MQNEKKDSKLDQVDKSNDVQNLIIYIVVISAMFFVVPKIMQFISNRYEGHSFFMSLGVTTVAAAVGIFCIVKIVNIFRRF